MTKANILGDTATIAKSAGVRLFLLLAFVTAASNIKGYAQDATSRSSYKPTSEQTWDTPDQLKKDKTDQRDEDRPSIPVRNKFNPSTPIQNKYSPSTPSQAKFSPSTPVQAKFNPSTPVLAKFSPSTP